MYRNKCWDQIRIRTFHKNRIRPKYTDPVLQFCATMSVTIKCTYSSYQNFSSFLGGGGGGGVWVKNTVFLLAYISIFTSPLYHEIDRNRRRFKTLTTSPYITFASMKVLYLMYGFSFGSNRGPKGLMK